MVRRVRGVVLWAAGLVAAAVLFGALFQLSAGPTAGDTAAIHPLEVGSAAAAPALPDWAAKVDPWVLETAARESETEFLLVLNAQADLSGAERLHTKEEKGRYVMERLQSTAAKTQPPVVEALKELGVEYESYWIMNMIWVRGTAAEVEVLAQRGDIAHLYANPSVRAPEPVPADVGQRAQSWDNIGKINAPAVWALGVNGAGVVIGGQDTGYDWDHPALINQYRGWDGAAEDHNYNWHDAIHGEDSHSPAINPCGLDVQIPCDDHGHGTHTMGTMVGEHPTQAFNLGVAPGAKWIGCRNMESGYGTPATYAECYQWFIAPTDLNGQNADPAMAPDIISNSWGCPVSEGCTDPNVLKTVVENVRAAGILTVHSAGNEGSTGTSGCKTIQTPGGIYDASFTVGSVDSNDVIAYNSSRGPVIVDGSNRRKPDISAPGVNIYSTHWNGGYTLMSGTSMAAPHVAGFAALLISAQPGLAGEVDALEWLITQSAVPLYSSQGCGGDLPTSLPNHVYGYGRIDALAACELLNNVAASALAVTGIPLDAGTAILTYTLVVSYVEPMGGGLRTAQSMTVTAVLPDGGTILTATQPNVQDGNIITWTHPGLEPWGSWQVVLVVQTPLRQDGSAFLTEFFINNGFGFFFQPFPVSWAEERLFLPVVFK